MSQPTDTVSKKARRDAALGPSKNWGPGFFAKVVIMALIDAIGVFGVYQAWTVRSMPIVVVMVLLVIAANVVYFSKRMIPAKYLYPGMVFLLVFQIYVMAYTAYVSFTNYGQGHMGTKQDAITAIQGQNQVRSESNTDTYKITLLSQGQDLYLATARDGQAVVGGAGKPLAEASGATLEGETVTAVPGYDVLDSAAILQRQKEVTDLRVPLSDDAAEGSLGPNGLDTAVVFVPVIRYDAAADTMVDSASGTVYKDNGRGNFAADDGTRIPNDVGWSTAVGFRNYTALFTDGDIARPFAQVLAWTIAFAFLSVATTFILGLLLAIVFNSQRLRGQKIYRVLLILPYAFPSFMSALLWKAMLNDEFGVINATIFGGASVPWLTDPWLAKLSIILVNLWLGYPYMFLVTTGALQSIPGDMMESARVDGASPFRQFRSITLPLLFISVAPLLISSFAFNFNNFNLIFFLTGGGPMTGTDMTKPGATDILISMVYRVAGVDNGQPDYGLATALSIVIFIIVGAIAAWSFRQTRKLEEMA
jgi:arabinogalactan oligomer/maltooligosaccharide transport system permease protein